MALRRKPAPHPGVLFKSSSNPDGRISGAGRWFIQTGGDNGPDFSFVDVMCYVREVSSEQLYYESVNMMHHSQRVKQTQQNTVSFYETDVSFNSSYLVILLK